MHSSRQLLSRPSSRPSRMVNFVIERPTSSKSCSAIPSRLRTRHPLASPTPRLACITRATASETVSSTPSTTSRSHETDIVIIGSGLGGLCAGAILGKYGYKVTIVESHYLPGGAAHSFVHKDGQGREWEFEAGPSFHAGLSMEIGKSDSPLKQVLDAIGESVPCMTYDHWRLYLPEGEMKCVAESNAYAAEIRRVGGEASYQAWKRIERMIQPLGEAAAMLPASALRFDAGIAVTTTAAAGPLNLLKTAFSAAAITGDFASKVVEKCQPTDFIRNLMDLECFVLSGMPARDTITAEMAFMFALRGGKTTIDYPVGGTYAIVQALIRGVEKFGGRLLLKSHVDEILTENGRAVGVRLRGAKNETIRARTAVISNASVWDTQKILSEEIKRSPSAAVQSWMQRSRATRPTDSFLHLHLGIDGTGLEGLECHHVAVNGWPVERPRNVILTSFPTVFDPAMAPEGKHIVHCYSAANEPYADWEHLKPGSAEYQALKEERMKPLWEVLERIVPDIRARTEVCLPATPLTHERFLRRHRGSYGPAIRTGEGEMFAGPFTPVPGLFVCGDSTQPGIGCPAAAASGMICANSLSLAHVPLQLELMKTIAGKL